MWLRQSNRFELIVLLTHAGAHHFVFLFLGKITSHLWIIPFAIAVDPPMHEDVLGFSLARVGGLLLAHCRAACVAVILWAQMALGTTYLALFNVLTPVSGFKS